MRSRSQMAVAGAMAIPAVAVITVVIALPDAGAGPPAALGYPRAAVAASTDPAPSDEEGFTSSVLAATGLREVAPPRTEFSVTRVRTAADVGVLFGEFRDTATDDVVPTEPLTVLGTRTGTRWDIALPGDADFCPILRDVPDSLLTLADTSYFLGCQGDGSAPGTSAVYSLPYSIDSGARITVDPGEGSHSEATGGRWAIDVAHDATPGFAVRAARGGVVRGVRGDSDVGCGDLSCWTDANYVLIDHGDGTSGLYVHLAAGKVVVHEGDVVARGQMLGVAGTTGSSTGAHLHVQVQATPCLTDTCRERPGWWWGRSVEVTFEDPVGAADDVVGDVAPASSIEDSDSRSTPTSAGDWHNTTYTLSCGGLSARPVTVTVHNGEGRAPADGRSPSGYWVRVAAVASGDLTGDGRAETAVMLRCSYLGANFSMPGVLVFTESGSRRAELPALKPHKTGFSHVEMDADTFAIRDRKLLTRVGHYVAGDIHVAGPSVWVTLLWQWDGERFTTTLPFGPRCRSGVDSVGLTNLCIEIPADWIAVRDVSTWLGSDWIDVKPYPRCNVATPCRGFQVYAASSFDRRFAGNAPERPFDQDSDEGWWTGTGTPTCHSEYYLPNPVRHSQLVTSDVRPFGSETAEFRQWTITCHYGGEQEVSAWILPASRLLVVSGPLPATDQQQVASVVAGATIS